MKKIYKQLFIICFAFATVTSCEFGDTNVDPAVPTDVAMSALLPSGEAAVSWAIGGEMVRISGLLTQQFEGINAQQLDNYKYLIRDADMDGVWQRMYHNSLNTINVIIKKSQEQNAPHYEGVAKVLMAAGIGTFTDAFGDIPYTSAFGGDEGNFTPTYDTQEQLYTTIIPGLLDDAIAKLSAAESAGGSPGSDDQIFGGDLDLWIAAAHSLKMRYTFQMAKRDAGAYDDALAMLPDVISSNSEDFEMYFGSGANETNPQYQFSQSRAGNIKMGEYFINAFSDDDTREALFINDIFELGEGANGYYTVSAAPVVLMSYVEVKFIEGESHLMKAAPDEAAAKAALDEAVNASFNKITGSGTPVAYQADLDARWTVAADKLEVLIDEKYIATYSQSIVVWNDYRRTGYPALEFVAGGTNAFNTNGEIPRRLPYPQEERLLNLSNLPIKTPNLQTPVWWDE
ncbi:SusD/RagB family nutrient-binding outer membrane lipoprotein [Fulvivirga ulvae]|uniref:SusD/RagB family nutrient-binding outer membrane lipoprotein n=1 Tax=Fulvivirga ulvae TaxID=2904245 RepID=UPI001F36C35C|nr:SusD/RagB family nutrient-binding outer membrane lipoprotein [Fulvivirga ulvae]UII34326.1 SusD/RagB family nutrient-binding outer membrane lipoprotein [Fulvivirga ulvae]